MRRIDRLASAAIVSLGLGTSSWASSWASSAASAQTLPDMRSIQVHGQTIRYIEAGQGPDLVLLHGLGSSAAFDWGAVIPTLAQRYHVLAMDQLGFGQSAKPLIAYGVQTWVDMLDGFLKARHVTRFALDGESLGGWIAGLYTVEAESNPGMALPERLILTDAAGHGSIVATGVHAFSGAASLSAARAGLLTLFHDPSLVTPARVQQAFEARLSEGNQFTQDSFWKHIDDPSTFLDDKVASITIPTLIVWGDDDRLVPLAQGRDYAAHIKGARLVVVPQSGHGPAIERPGAYLAAIAPFLNGLN